MTVRTHIHHAYSATYEEHTYNGTRWVDITWRDKDGQEIVSLTVFPDDDASTESVIPERRNHETNQ